MLGLILEAKRAECPVVAFVRDADDDENRPAVVDAAIGKAATLFPEIGVIGGTARPVLEAWILAILGEHRTEKLGKTAAQSLLTTKGGIPIKDTAAMVNAILKMSISALPPDATTLLRWLDTARYVLAPAIKE